MHPGKFSKITSGFSGLDQVVDWLRIGDNVVWQVDDIEDYALFLRPFVKAALRQRKRVVYMRFGDHRPLIESEDGVITYVLNAQSGFESFSTQVYQIATREGRGVMYVFDCLSDLLSAWATDLMIGNFFTIACPYLFELDTVAYFAIMRNSHSYKTVARIREITQVLLDVGEYGGTMYVHPLKVWNRYSPSMFFPHQQNGDCFVPVVNSLEATRLFSDVSRQRIKKTTRQLDYWDRLSLEAEMLLEDSSRQAEQDEMVDKLCRIMIGREPRMLSLVKTYFSLKDLLAIKARLIGTGFIGGKTVGMLLARKMLQRHDPVYWQARLEPHDSFYVGSDVFYSYLVQSGCWKLRMEQRTKEGYFECASALRQKMLEGTFPDEIRDQFVEIIEYFGQSPIIVRSSSLLEDSFGNAFAGKYESLFCVNQGTPEERYAQFERLVRRVFASTMNEDALIYRLERGLDQQDEQMALLVQRVSGRYRKQYFFPDVGGVGVSYNTFVWQKGMDPQAGMLRLVLGLGTRAVNRVEGDYPRIVALDAPSRRPHNGMGDLRRFSQHDVDLLNREENLLQTLPLRTVLHEGLDVRLDLMATHDYEIVEAMRERGMKSTNGYILTFDELLGRTSFPTDMQLMLKELEARYDYPVDIEFTVNFTEDGTFQVNLLQCRPLQTVGEGRRVKIPKDIDRSSILFSSEGHSMGGNVSHRIHRVVYIDPEHYSRLPVTQRYEVARMVGRLNKRFAKKGGQRTALLGPGRWGTSTPSLGVPVKFAEINNMSMIGEISYRAGNLIPDLSYGTHFFQDLVEAQMFYVALFPEADGVTVNTSTLESYPNELEDLLPEAHSWRDVLKVYSLQQERLRIISEVVSQRVICYFEKRR